jgi:DNA polymerase-3 subunit epsilon
VLAALRPCHRRRPWPPGTVGAAGFAKDCVPVNPARAVIEYLLGGPKVGGVDEARWRRWSALPAPALAVPHGRTRYVVVAAGTARHALRHERLASIGAVGVRHGQIDLADCFAAALRQRRAPVDALIRGQLGEAPAAGVEPKAAMLDFLEYLGKAPLVAFRASEERPIFERAAKSILGVPFRQTWLDLSVLLPALFPRESCTTRDEWLGRFDIAPAVARDAPGDAFVTAQLFLVTLDAAIRAGLVNAAQLIAAQDLPQPVHA